MNTELMAAWNGSSVDGPRWEDMTIVEQNRLEDFAEALEPTELLEKIDDLESEVINLEELLESARKERDELKAAAKK